MRRAIPLGGLFLVLACATASPAQVGIIDPFQAIVTMNHSGPEPAVVCHSPDGSGDGLDSARTISNVVVDARITVTLYDYNGLPVENLPGEDLWLDSDDGGLVFCPGGTAADGPTDALGRTTWSGPFRAGGWSSGATIILVNGQVLPVAPIALRHNSPDLDGNLVVDLRDVTLFTRDFYGSYAFRSDLHHDGVINLSDIAELSRLIGHRCP